MKTSITLIFVSAALFIAACSEEPTQPTSTAPLIGTWVELRREADATVMRRAPGLDAEKPGFVFNLEGKFQERMNSGWCGTPPIVYANYAGEWTQQTDSTIHIDVDYWGGRTHYNMRIISLDFSELRFVHEPPH